MINSFENYLKLGKVKTKTPDKEEAKALLEKAKERIEYVKEKTMNSRNAKFILEDSYEAIRESAQALMSIEGYKPYSHEATIAFLRDKYQKNFTDEDIYNFDRFRQLRNDSVYKAVEIIEGDAESCLKFADVMIKKMEGIIKSVL